MEASLTLDQSAHPLSDAQLLTDLSKSPFPPPPFHLLFPRPKLDANMPPILADFLTNPEYLQLELSIGVSETGWRKQPALASLERPPSPEHEPFQPPQSSPLLNVLLLACFTFSGNPSGPTGV